MTKVELIRKLTSRKFWAAVVGFVTGLLVFLGKTVVDAEKIGALVMMGASVVAYIFGEGWADSAGTIINSYEMPTEEMKPPEEIDE